jgi:hypothetical protein
MTIKYLVCPGEVRSQFDGQVHFISAYQLMALYSVSAKECAIKPPGRSTDGYQPPDGLIELRPDPTGEYELPKEPT